MMYKRTYIHHTTCITTSIRLGSIILGKIGSYNYAQESENIAVTTKLSSSIIIVVHAVSKHFFARIMVEQ